MKFYNFNDYLLQSFGVLTFKNFAESALSETSLHDVSFLQDCLQLVLLVLEWECNGGFLSADSLDFALNVLLMQVEKVLMFLASCFQFHMLSLNININNKPSIIIK